MLLSMQQVIVKSYINYYRKVLMLPVIKRQALTLGISGLESKR